MIDWVTGPSLKSFSETQLSSIQYLFKNETGEHYIPDTIRALPIPIWKGNLILVDEDSPTDIHGVFWCLRFNEKRARVVAFVIDKNFQNQGFGSKAWDLFVMYARTLFISEIQLEVRANNQRAIEFYQRRGLKIIGKLENYYSSGLGYVMQGKI